VRQGRPQKSKVFRGTSNPEFMEDFFLVVDNIETQTLSIKVMDQDMLMPDDQTVGVQHLYFSTEKIVTDEVTGEEKVRRSERQFAWVLQGCILLLCGKSNWCIWESPVDAVAVWVGPDCACS
jgi:hypothetical protein